MTNILHHLTMNLKIKVAFYSSLMLHMQLTNSLRDSMIKVCLHYDLEGQGYKLFPVVEYM